MIVKLYRCDTCCVVSGIGPQEVLISERGAVDSFGALCRITYPDPIGVCNGMVVPFAQFAAEKPTT